jgi:chromosome segregation ATPase
MRRSTRAKGDPYGPQAELAAQLAETNFREAATKRAERDQFEARAAEIEERERALAAREQLIRALENRLEDSRRRLEERLQQVKERRPSVVGMIGAIDFHLPNIDEAYFDAGSNVDEEAWWSRQLGKPPRLAA